MFLTKLGMSNAEEWNKNPLSSYISFNITGTLAFTVDPGQCSCQNTDPGLYQRYKTVKQPKNHRSQPLLWTQDSVTTRTWISAFTVDPRQRNCQNNTESRTFLSMQPKQPWVILKRVILMHWPETVINALSSEIDSVTIFIKDYHWEGGRKHRKLKAQQS